MHYRVVKILNESLNLIGKLGAHASFLLPNKAVLKQNSDILFLCSGNICRSAYAEFKLKELAKLKGFSNLTISSAGLRTHNGKNAYPKAIDEAKNREIEMGDHKTRCATEEMLNKATVVFLMEPIHKIWLKQLDPSQRAFYLGAHSTQAGYPLTVSDPYGKAAEEFVTCFNQIDTACEEMLEGLTQ